MASAVGTTSCGSVTVLTDSSFSLPLGERAKKLRTRAVVAGSVAGLLGGAVGEALDTVALLDEGSAIAEPGERTGGDLSAVDCMEMKLELCSGFDFFGSLFEGIVFHIFPPLLKLSGSQPHSDCLINMASTGSVRIVMYPFQQ
jgi:hypothetical protein